MSKQRLQPIGDRVLVTPAKTEAYAGKLHIPEAYREKPQECLVVALGTGKVLTDGRIQPFPVKEGARIIVSKYGGAEVTVDGKEYKIVSTDDILAVVDPK